ncbi:hypothetical protein KI688_006271 [Linnemannia hyalina]|uniref:PiggyBac transposable element-derived protein domain-containing protein n=1 Tax=Linnemannia hyalina TaxID=64524 RepID=A0A9P7Y2D2_9FUNG|nr:hypothetical protein KI688_006271 [Linnemannia hyalina]
MDSSLEFLGSFDVSDSQGTVVASAEEVDEAQEEELLFSVRCRTRPTPGTDSSGDEEEGKAGDEGVIDAPAPPTKKMKAAKKAAKKPVRETRELPPVPDFDNIFRHYKDGHPAQSNLPRALQLDQELAPINIFSLFFSGKVFSDMATFTNAYAASKGAGTGGGLRQWVKTIPDELRIFLGIIVYMGVFRQNSVSEYYLSPCSSPSMPSASATTTDPLSKIQTPSRESANAKSVRDAYKGHSRALLPIPKIVDDYNHHMNGLDIADQLRSYYSTQLRTYRAWAPIFFWLLDTTIINAYLINKLFGSFMHHRGFRQFQAKDLIVSAKCAGGDAGATDVDEDVDDDAALKRPKKIIFKPGHIQLCW